MVCVFVGERRPPTRPPSSTSEFVFSSCTIGGQTEPNTSHTFFGDPECERAKRNRPRHDFDTYDGTTIPDNAQEFLAAIAQDQSAADKLLSRWGLSRLSDSRTLGTKDQSVSASAQAGNFHPSPFQSLHSFLHSAELLLTWQYAGAKLKLSSVQELNRATIYEPSVFTC